MTKLKDGQITLSKVHSIKNNLSKRKSHPISNKEPVINRLSSEIFYKIHFNLSYKKEKNSIELKTFFLKVA